MSPPSHLNSKRPPPRPYPAAAKIRFGSSNSTTVGILAVLWANRLFSRSFDSSDPYSQSSLPESAPKLITPSEVRVTYCRTPPAVLTMTDEYPADSPFDDIPFHFTLPVFLSRASIVASRPPGVTISLSPSTSGDSAYPHPPPDPL